MKELSQLYSDNHIVIIYETLSTVNYEAIQSYRVQVITSSNIDNDFIIDGCDFFRKMRRKKNH